MLQGKALCYEILRKERIGKIPDAKSEGNFGEVSLHIENSLWNTAVNRLYYACYYAVIALLAKNEINVQTHTGVRQMFGLHFVKSGKITKESGKFFSDIFDKRQTGDYDDFIDYSKEEVLDLVGPAKNLIIEIEGILDGN